MRPQRGHEDTDQKNQRQAGHLREGQCFADEAVGIELSYAQCFDDGHGNHRHETRGQQRPFPGVGNEDRVGDEEGEVDHHRERDREDQCRGVAVGCRLPGEVIAIGGEPEGDDGEEADLEDPELAQAHLSLAVQQSGRCGVKEDQSDANPPQVDEPLVDVAHLPQDQGDGDGQGPCPHPRAQQALHLGGDLRRAVVDQLSTVLAALGGAGGEDVGIRSGSACGSPTAQRREVRGPLGVRAGLVGRGYSGVRRFVGHGHGQLFRDRRVPTRDQKEIVARAPSPNLCRRCSAAKELVDSCEKAAAGGKTSTSAAVIRAARLIRCLLVGQRVVLALLLTQPDLLLDHGLSITRISCESHVYLPGSGLSSVLYLVTVGGASFFRHVACDHARLRS